MTPSPDTSQTGQAGIIAMRDLLRHLREQGKTVFLSSHLLGELEQVADWLVMLHQGKALFSGPARELLDRRGEGVSLEESFLSMLKGEQS
jgi:ABC-type multidrug transport system ATPase subunit